MNADNYVKQAQTTKNTEENCTQFKNKKSESNSSNIKSNYNSKHEVSKKHSPTKTTANPLNEPKEVASENPVKSQNPVVIQENNVNNYDSIVHSVTDNNTNTAKEPVAVNNSKAQSDFESKYAAAGTVKYTIVKKITKIKVYKLKKYKYKKWYKYKGKWRYKIYYKYKKVFAGYKYSVTYSKVPIQTVSSSANTSSIVSLAKSLNGSTQYETANKIFNWVRDNIKYSFYYNTKYGAAGTLKNRQGNCVDHSHLLISLAQNAGLTARYVHATCKFNSGNTYGHVWAQILVNGQWLNADATSSLNSLGVIKNWSNSVVHGVYNTLPF